jgi:hypothetical protein
MVDFEHLAAIMEGLESKREANREEMKARPENIVAYRPAATQRPRNG